MLCMLSLCMSSLCMRTKVRIIPHNAPLHPALRNRRHGFATNMAANPTYTCIMAGKWAGWAYDEFVGDPSSSTQASPVCQSCVQLNTCNLTQLRSW
jgi:hypothetical protein